MVSLVKSLSQANYLTLWPFAPGAELNSSSPMDEFILEDSSMALGARSGSAIFDDPIDPFYPLINKISRRGMK